MFWKKESMKDANERRYCPSCGSEVNGEEQFCLYCGVYLPADNHEKGISGMNTGGIRLKRLSGRTNKTFIAIASLLTVIALAILIVISIGWRANFLVHMCAGNKNLKDTIGNKSFALVVLECDSGKKLKAGKYSWEDDSGKTLIWYHGVIENRGERDLNLNNLHAALYIDNKKMKDANIRFFERKSNGTITNNTIERVVPGKQADFYVFCPMGQKGKEDSSELLISYSGGLKPFGPGRAYVFSEK